ncbi:MAG: fructosamine kinase family protein [Actinomycetes bacterium]|nr:fructosamine kinase family protein [Actinomycetes bacterium]MDX5380729.1 fructosamine kinase family protein [Actinomycetes bacterium]MDX5399728.1 fructosamine kinase family protein [Actinomycetes bacterium]MDX5450467.1 fructosamine kinase family protein [Actinomycetes bacterium]
MTAFRKAASPAAIASEAASLRWLAAADGGALVVPLLATGAGWLETRRLRTVSASPAAAEAFGRALAATHAAGAQWFGQGPPGLAPSDSRLAELPHPVAGDAAEAAPSWGPFYAEARVRPYVRLARDRGSLSAGDARVLETVLHRLESGELDAPQPAACPPVARLHGDLWGGNVLWSDDHPDAPGTVSGVLIDPAAHGGHAETDLAELALFGSPFLERTLAAYDEASPLADGWRERVGLHQVHMLAVHAALFGGGYGAQLVRAARDHGPAAATCHGR